MRVVFNIFNQWDKMVFEIPTNTGILKPDEVAGYLFGSIKDICSKMKQIPIYKGKLITELVYNCEVLNNGKMKISIQ